MKLIATCGKGLEQLLAAEIRGLGFDPMIEVGAVAFEAEHSAPAVRLANWKLRTANRVLLVLGGWKASNEQDLYYGAFRLVKGWRGSLFAPEMTLSIRASSSASNLRDVGYIGLKVKDGIVDGQRENFGSRSSIDRDNPTLPLRVRLHRNRATLLFDTSGEPLDRRGYRVESTEAPLRETLAAAAILASGWDGTGPIVDPMCGSGTLLAEAAMISAGCSPQQLRRRFAFMGLQNHDRQAFQDLKSQEPPLEGLDLYGGDLSEHALLATRDNLDELGLKVKLRNRDAIGSEPPPGGPGLLAVNPPHGARLAAPDWRRVGTWLDEQYAGWARVMVVGAEHDLGIEPAQAIPIRNGPLEGWILTF